MTAVKSSGAGSSKSVKSTALAEDAVEPHPGPAPESTAATRLREIADRTEREADYEDDGYAAHELREEAMFLRETADLLARNRKLWLALECAADLLGNDGYADDPDYRQEWKQISEALQDA